MKTKELIEELRKFPEESEVQILVWVLAMKSNKVIPNITKIKGVSQPLDMSKSFACITTEAIEEEI